MSDVAVVGAGLAGCVLAGLVARRGHRVTLYERRADPRVTGAERGRSINLAISARAIAALRTLGIADEVLADALPMRGRMIHAPDGSCTFQPYSADGLQAINSISRARLNAALLDALRGGIETRFEHRLVDLRPDEGGLTCHTPDGLVEARADVVLGADGAHSAVRRRLQDTDGFDYQQVYLAHGYRELTMPPVRRDFALDPGALHIWPRGASMMIALPNPDRSFTCTLFWPKTGPGSFATTGPDEITGRVAAEYPDALALLPDLVDDYTRNPLGSLITVRCAPWQVGRVGLVGDAAHAIVPFYGQGANCALEDCVALDAWLERTGDDWPAALAGFSADRKPHADAIADMALENFVEMRDRVASPTFLAWKRLEHALERLAPNLYASQYELVSFSTMPYADIRRRVRTQRRVLAGALGLGGALALAALRPPTLTRKTHDR